VIFLVSFSIRQRLVNLNEIILCLKRVSFLDVQINDVASSLAFLSNKYCYNLYKVKALKLILDDKSFSFSLMLIVLVSVIVGSGRTLFS